MGHDAMISSTFYVRIFSSQPRDPATRRLDHWSPNPWLALVKAQSLAAERGMPHYVWEDDTPVATVYPDGRIVITL